MGNGPEGEPTYEEAVSELEQIVRQLETGDLPLETSLALYERGVALARICALRLEDADRRLRVLVVDDSGRPVLRPLESVDAG